MIRVVTDSNSQIPPSLAQRFRIAVVPLTVTIDGVEYAEGVDLDVDAFYARFGDRRPTVTTAQPAPARFVDTYRTAAAEGADAVLSVHIGSAISGTVNSARLAADAVDVPVRIVDTGTASFAVALCAWAAAEALAHGGDLDAAEAAAQWTASHVGNVFVVQALELARAGGRLAADAQDVPDIPVLTMSRGLMQVVGRVGGYEEVADVMAAHVLAGGTGLRVGIGVADAAVFHMWEALEARLVGKEAVREVVRYRVGPSVAVHTGPGTVGAMYAPAG